MNKDTQINRAGDEAYWISPEGKIYLLNKQHIDMIFDDPGLFGLDIKYIESVFDSYNEEYRSEGKAREEILLLLFKKNWIRARKYLRPYRWSINVVSIDDKSAENLKSFAVKMIEKGHSLNDEVLLDTLDWKRIYTLNELQKLISH